MDLASRDIVGAEALLRWQHPEKGLVAPEDFLPVAEESGLIVPIGEWVLRTACGQNCAWQQAGLPQLQIAVNVSSRQFGRNVLLRAVRHAVAVTGHFPQHLALEITETCVVGPEDSVKETLRSLRELGIQICIEDFGIGFSSLAYLKHFPVDLLKIDRGFLADLARSPGDRAIVQAVIAMAQGLELRVGAEGVETEAQLEFLRDHGCNTGQGFIFSEPLPADAFEKLLREAAPE